jgi:iron complex outermembrane recepter protein
MKARELSKWMFVLAALTGPGMKAGEPPAAARDAQAAKTKEEKAAKEGRFKLGEVTVPVTGRMEAVEAVNVTVTREHLQAFGRDTVATALDQTPGVSLSLNSRNEQMIYLRGLDSRQVAVFVDGVPVYVPYDGEMDYARFTTFDLSEIQVAKGFSSITFGPNTLGGAINLVTRRPVKAFEGDLSAGVFSERGRKASFNAGSRVGAWYFQAGASNLSMDGWRLSSDFRPTVREDGGMRNNSDALDRHHSLKVGFNPSEGNEYVVSWNRQRGEKGNPVATAADLPPTFWRWPTWDKDSVYFTSSTAFASKSTLKSRVYHDEYVNTIQEYTDGTFATPATTGGRLKPTGRSFYRDFSNGAALEWDTLALDGHLLRASLQGKSDVHREDNGLIASTAAWKRYEDRLVSAGVEDSIAIGRTLDVALGLGWDQLRPVSAGTWHLPASQSFLHGQAAFFWQAATNTKVHVSVAQKDHFPTLKDRYSLKLGTYLENPDLKPERALNVELGVSFKPSPWLALDATLFRSDIRDLIQGQPVTGTALMQMRNLGEVRHQGVELGAEATPCTWFEGGLGYTYLDRRNLSDPATLLTSTPRNRVTGHLRFTPLKGLRLQAKVESQNGQWDSYANTARQTVNTELGGFTTVAFSAGWDPCRGVSLEGGLSNLLDRNYTLGTGYPMPGRTWSGNVRYRF